MAKSTKSSGKRSLIEPNGGKRYVRRTAQGQFIESDDVGKSLSHNVKKSAKTKVKPGYGDKGDQPKKKASMGNETYRQEDRVKEATPSSINREIEKKMWSTVGQYINKSSEEITTRIQELEKEWDIERYLGVNMSTVALSGLAAGVFSKNKNWLFVPAVVLGFFMQHAIQGWCPPLPVLRHFKIRTQKEIEQEKYALKLIRGDFDNLENISPQEIEKLQQAMNKS